MTGPLATAKNVLLQDAPTYGPWRATTTLDATDLVRFGAPGAGIEAGIVVWESENPNKFSKFVLSRGSFSDPTFVVKHEHTVNNASTLQAARDVTRPTDAISKITIRVTKTTLDGEVYGEYSLNGGESWKRIGNGSAGRLRRTGAHRSAEPPPDRPHGRRLPRPADRPLRELQPRSGRLRRARDHGVARHRQPAADGTYKRTVTVDLSATDPVVNAGEGPKTHDIDAYGFDWLPNTLTIDQGDTVKWNFAGGFHDICIDTAAPALPQFQANCGADERVATAITGATAGQKQFNQAGTYDVLLLIPHAEHDRQGHRRPRARRTVPSGVAFTEYRLSSGDAVGEWTRRANEAGDAPFKTAVTVDTLGKHVVEYRSTDAAKHQEAVKSVAFEVVEALPDPVVTPPAANSQLQPARHEPAGHQPARAHPARQADRDEAEAGSPATTTAKFAKRGLKITAACEAGFTGTGDARRQQDASPQARAEEGHHARLQGAHVQHDRQGHGDTEGHQEAPARDQHA